MSFYKSLVIYALKRYGGVCHVGVKPVDLRIPSSVVDAGSMDDGGVENFGKEILTF